MKKKKVYSQNPKKYSHCFDCRDCKEKFIITSEFSSHLKLKDVICPRCKKEWGKPGSNIWIDFNPSRGFLHPCTLRFSQHEKKIIEKLPPGKVLAKTSDGVSRVCDVVKK